MIKSIDQVANNFDIKRAANQLPQQKSFAVPEQSAKVINDLFKRLKSIFPAWRNAFPTADLEAQAKREWTQAFFQNRIFHTKQIELATKKARNWGKPWLPSVGQFIQWCELSAEDLGLPSENQAFTEARTHFGSAFKHNWSHEVVHAAAIATGLHAFSTMSFSDAEKEFKRNYEIVLRRYAEGEDISEHIPKALPSKIPNPTARDQSLANIQNIKNQLFNRGA